MNPQITPFVGPWRIVEMELWDRDYIDLEGPAHITFDSSRMGSFQFGAVRGWIDYRVSSDNSVPKVEFSWEGTNDADATCGRGWATIADDKLVGRLFFHNGDDSAFIAERSPNSGRGRSRLRRPAPHER